MMKPIGQLQHEDLGEMKTTIEVPQKTTIPLYDHLSLRKIRQISRWLSMANTTRPAISNRQSYDDSTDAIPEERVQEGRTPEVVEDLRKTKPSETIMEHQQEQREISAARFIGKIPRETGIVEPKLHYSTIDSELGNSQSGPCPIIDKEKRKEIDKAVPASKLPTVKTSQDSEVDGLKETAEQGFQEQDKPNEDAISIQQRSFGLCMQSGLSSDNSLAKELSQHLETGKQVVGIATVSEASMTTTSSNSEVDSMKETIGQCFQEHDASLAEAATATQSAALEPRKQCESSKTGKEAGGNGMLVASHQSSMSTTSTNSETVEQKLENAAKPNLPNVTPSLNYQSSIIGIASPCTTLGILEIFQLVEFKDGGEASLLAQALGKYPELLLPRQEQNRGKIAFSYRILVDILVMLATKTPCSITPSEKTTLKNNLCVATILGFNQGWVDSVRAKVFDVDMSDFSSAQEKIRTVEAKLEACDKSLKQVQEEKKEARRKLKIAQSQFDATDSRMLALLEDHKTLMANMTKFKDIISAKDTPFGI